MLCLITVDLAFSNRLSTFRLPPESVSEGNRRRDRGLRRRRNMRPVPARAVPRGGVFSADDGRERQQRRQGPEDEATAAGTGWGRGRGGARRRRRGGGPPD